jgi:hypothetical protein
METDFNHELYDWPTPEYYCHICEQMQHRPHEAKRGGKMLSDFVIVRSKEDDNFVYLRRFWPQLVCYWKLQQNRSRFQKIDLNNFFPG